MPEIKPSSIESLFSVSLTALRKVLRKVNIFISSENHVGIGTLNPAVSAVLDLTSTDGALLVPRMTSTERDALTAINGMILYNSTTGAFNFYEGGAWVTK